RCPSACATQFQSPNGDYSSNYEADSMASWLAAALSEVVTDPYNNAWYDRYGMEYAEKCEGTYGETYTVTNQAGQLPRANITLDTGSSVMFNFDFTGQSPAPPYAQVNVFLDVTGFDSGESLSFTAFNGLNGTGGAAFSLPASGPLTSVSLGGTFLEMVDGVFS